MEVQGLVLRLLTVAVVLICVVHGQDDRRTTAAPTDNWEAVPLASLSTEDVKAKGTEFKGEDPRYARRNRAQRKHAQKQVEEVQNYDGTLVARDETGILRKGCETVKCDDAEVCVWQTKIKKPVCVLRNLTRVRSSKKVGNHHKFRFSSKTGSSHDDEIENITKHNLHHAVKKLKYRASEFGLQHDRIYKRNPLLTMNDEDDSTKPRLKKFVEDNRVENAVDAKQTNECRPRDLDNVGRQLLDRFKTSQDEDLDEEKIIKRKRRKEKRNSTKKELHDDDECICQAPVSWQFMHLDSDADGHLSERELVNLTSLGTCASVFIGTCNHDVDAALSEKEWCCCFADVLPPCLASLNNVPSILLRGEPMILPGAFVPRCDDDGFYSKVQCNGGTGDCWCVDRNGKRIEDASTSSENPECAGSVSKSEEHSTRSSVRQ